MLDRIETLLKIPVLPPEEEMVQRRRLMIIYLCLGLATLILIPFVPAEVRSNTRLYIQTIAFYLVWTLYCLIGGGILWISSVWKAALWLTIGVYAYVSYAVLLNGGVPHNFLTAYYLVILIYAALFLGRRATLIFVFIIGVSSSALNVVNVPGWLMPVFSPGPTSLNVVSWILFWGIFSYLLLTYLDSMEGRQALIRKSEERYRLLFEVSPAALWEQDASEALSYVHQLQAKGVDDIAAYFAARPAELADCMRLMRVLNVNETAVSMFKSPDKQSLMNNLYSLLSREAQSICLASLAAMANGRTSFEREISFRRVTGETIQAIYRWIVTPGHEQTYRHIITSLTDITPQKEAEAVQRRFVERLNIIHQIDVAVLAAESVLEITQATLELLQELVPYAQAQVALFDSTAGEILYSIDDTRRRDLVQRADVSIWDALQGMAQGSILQFDDLGSGDDLPPLLNDIRKNGGRSLFIVPLWAQQEMVGAIGVIFSESGGFNQEHVEIVQQIAAPLAIATQNARLFEAEKIERQRAETLRQMANILNASLEQDQLLDSILEQLAQVIPFDSATVSLKIDDAFQIVAHRGLEIGLEKLITEQIPMLTHVTQVLESHCPHIIADTRESADWLDLALGQDIRCWLGVPMLARGEIIGLLTLDKYEPNYYQESDAQLALAFANQAAIAVENARLYKQLQHYVGQLEQRVVERMRDLTTLYYISALSNAPAEIEPVLSSALETVLTALGCFAGAVHLMGDDGLFYLLHEIGVPEYVRPSIEQVPMDHEIVSDLLQPDAPVTSVKDIAATAFGELFTLTPGELTYAGTLMRSKGNLLGVLSAVHNAGRQFTLEDLALLGAIADHVAITIENGRLHQNARQVAILQERERMARELHDSVTQSLYSLSLFAEAGRELLEVDKVERVKVYLNQIVTTAVQSLREMRLMLYDLRSTTLLEEGLAHALQYRLENVEERAGIETYFTAPENLALPADVEEGLYRISQEALNNTLKHARASRVDVTIRIDGPHLVMCLRDNGRGFQAEDWPEKTTGHGLLTIQKQVEQFGGSFTLSSQPENGTSLTIRLNHDWQTLPASTIHGQSD